MSINIEKLPPAGWLAECRDIHGEVHAKTIEFDRETAATMAAALLKEAGYTTVSVKPLYSFEQIAAAKGE